MVVLSRIYTRTGDGGTTRLADGSDTPKTAPLLTAIGDVDEANAALGVALSGADLPTDLGTALAQVQHELFDLGAELSTPHNPSAEPDTETSSPSRLQIEQSHIDQLEQWCDHFNEGLPVLRSFILPGGTPTGAALHLARAVVRRAERSVWAHIAVDQSAGLSLLPAVYLNRLSDLLFIAVRVVNGVEHEVLWRPGGERSRD